MTKLLLPFAALAVLTLAACDNAPTNEPAATVQTEPNGTTTVQIEVPDALAPAVEAAANPQRTFDDLRNQAGAMTDQAKRDAVVNARRAAEAAARALGQTEAEITQAGDVAERSAQDALGLR
ncbi:MAG: hypothetical protein KJ944_10300 [Alphaproteobacteria bacterium]|jgi:hypothetical protein|nr:hypothetical protein [Alphaproteobacteria bacterium]MBU1561747.1 hypothetical protein [Alphaproteobacteria bacterium]MBU2302979.1 hypothetical protein [Alphaproteobacteria bacterium]MBU2368766.1 hypothetical protein [Alphaproteobacteria bacterium]